MLLTFLVSLLIIYIPAASSVGVHPTFLTPLGVAGLVLINGIACWMGTKTALRGGADAAGELRAFKIFKLLKMGVVSFVFIAVFALNWPAYVWTLMGIRGEAVPVLPLVADVIVVLPVLCMIITAMAFRYRYQRVKKGRRLDVSSMIQYLVVRVRTELAILVVPWLLIILFSDLTAIIWSESPYFSSIDSAVSLGLLGGLIVLGPSALQYVWDTSSLPDGSLRDRLETLAEREGFGYRDIRLWDTDRHIPNAAVIGPFAPFRYVLMTDALLANCTEREVEGIFAHEVGHIRKHHMRTYAMAALTYVALSINWLALLDVMGAIGPVDSMLASEIQEGHGVALLLFTVFYWVVVFGYISRRFEQQADLFAVQACENPESFINALRKLSTLSGRPGMAGSWRHFSIARRVQFLREALDNPRIGERLQRRVGYIKKAIMVVFTLSVAGVLLMLG